MKQKQNRNIYTIALPLYTFFIIYLKQLLQFGNMMQYIQKLQGKYTTEYTVDIKGLQIPGKMVGSRDVKKKNKKVSSDIEKYKNCLTILTTNRKSFN